MKFRRGRITPVYMKDSADATANANTTALYFWRAPVDCELIGARIVANGTVTANSSNYATVLLLKGDGAAGTPVTAASIDTSSASWAAGNTYAMTKSTTIANLFLSKGHTIGFSITKTGTGVAVTAATAIEADIRPLNEV